MNNAQGLFDLKFLTAVFGLWFRPILFIKLGGWGISPSAEGDQRASPLETRHFRESGQSLIRVYFVSP